MEAEGEERQRADPELEALGLAWELALGPINHIVLHLAIDLDIFEVIRKNSPKIQLTHLAASLPIPNPNLQALRRIMTCLANMRLVQAVDEDHERYYTLTMAGTYFAGGAEKNLVALAPWIGSDACWKGWRSLRSCLVDDGLKRSAFEWGNGDTLWGYASKNPGFNHITNEAMVCNSQLVAPALIRSCPEVFDGVRSLVDVGGGTGTVATAICKAFPGIRATVLDLPHVVQGMSSTMPTVSFVGGDMFSAVPPGDAIILVGILHNWSDEDCLRILSRCREALVDGGKMIILDAVLGLKEEEELHRLRHMLDIVVLGLLGEAKERTKEEFGKLLSSAGFTKYNVKSIKAMQNLIEAYP